MNVFDLSAKISLDSAKYVDSLNLVKSTLGDFAKVSTAALGAAAAGVSALVKESVSSYGEYEQLVGGIETLFEDLSWDVEQNANQAFKTAGLSVNEYLNTAMSFSASLNQSLKRTDGNIARSADLTDMAIRDMADNANKMGTAMESIQLAYAGFAKQNYTMLDNLKLGYGGTKGEMERLLADAEAISGVHFDIENYSDIIEAIHTIQQDMGITGTTAKEAASTITGSASSVKSAWKNLTVEMAKDDGNVEKAFDDLAETAGAMIDNILPRIEKSLDGVSDLIAVSAPKLVKGVNKLIPRVVPSLAKAATSILGTLGSSIVENAPMLAETAVDVAKTIGDTLLGYFPDWFGSSIKDTFGSINSFVNSIDFGKLKRSFSDFSKSLEPLVEKISNGVAWAFDNVLKPFGSWFMNDAIPAGINALTGAFDVLNAALDVLAPVGEAVWQEFLSPLFSAVGDLAVGSFSLLGDGLKAIGETFRDFDTVGFIDDIMQGNFWENWKLGIETIAETLDKFGTNVDEFFRGPGEKWNSFWQNVGGWVYDAKETIVDALDAIKNALESVGNAIDKHNQFWGGFGEYVFDKLHGDKIPAFGDGGRVTRPTLAIVGEKEPETIVPDSKRNAFAATNGITININVEGGISSDYDVDRMVERLSERMSMLSEWQSRALGGAGLG